MAIENRILEHPTKKFREEYEVGKQLGKGSFGEVWRVTHKATREEYACKIIDKNSFCSEVELEDTRREIRILQEFAGQSGAEGVVQLKEVLEGDRAVYAVMELCRGGDLFELLKEHGALPEAAAKFLFRQMAEGLAFCHSHFVAHRDIKPENILLTAPATALHSVTSPSSDLPAVHARLADFGLAALLQPGGTATGYTGSKYYTAPEMLKGKRYGKRVDVWSMGVVLCTMLTGRLPFAGRTKQDEEGLRRAILRGKVHFDQPTWDGVSEEAKDLVTKMLQLDPKKRLTAEEVLVHPWLAQACTLSEDSSESDFSFPSLSVPSSPSCSRNPDWVKDGRPCVSAVPLLQQSPQTCSGGATQQQQELTQQESPARALRVSPECTPGSTPGMTATLAPAACGQSSHDDRTMTEDAGPDKTAPAVEILQFFTTPAAQPAPPAGCAQGTPQGTACGTSSSPAASRSIWCFPGVSFGMWRPVAKKVHPQAESGTGAVPPAPEFRSFEFQQSKKHASSRSMGHRFGPGPVDGAASSKKGNSGSSLPRVGEPHQCLAPVQHFMAECPPSWTQPAVYAATA